VGKAANYRDDCEKLDSTITKQGSSQGNIAIEQWAQDMPATTAKKLGERLSNSLAGGTVEKKDPPTPSAKQDQANGILVGQRCQGVDIARKKDTNKESSPVPPKLKESPTTEKTLSSNTHSNCCLCLRAKPRKLFHAKNYPCRTISIAPNL
jgi:hypothetical protein